MVRRVCVCVCALGSHTSWRRIYGILHKVDDFVEHTALWAVFGIHDMARATRIIKM